MPDGKTGSIYKSLSLHWVVGQSNELDISFCLYWWDCSSCDLTVENPFAPVHRPLFPPPNALSMPVPEMWLAATSFGAIVSGLGVNGIASVPPSFCFWQSGNKVRGVQVLEPAAAQSGEPFLETVPDDELLMWFTEMHRKIAHSLCPLWLLNALMLTYSPAMWLRNEPPGNSSEWTKGAQWSLSVASGREKGSGWDISGQRRPPLHAPLPVIKLLPLIIVESFENIESYKRREETHF